MWYHTSDKLKSFPSYSYKWRVFVYIRNTASTVIIHTFIVLISLILLIFNCGNIQYLIVIKNPKKDVELRISLSDLDLWNTCQGTTFLAATSSLPSKPRILTIFAESDSLVVIILLPSATFWGSTGLPSAYISIRDISRVVTSISSELASKFTKDRQAA